MLSFLEGPFCVQPFVPFLILFFFSFFGLVVSFSSIFKSFILGLTFDFFMFRYFVFRLESNRQKKNILSSIRLVLVRFVYRGFSFLSHAVRFWFAVFSKLALVTLDYYIGPFQPGCRKI